jgi:uncharacterized phage protein gp47/JayE
MSDRSGITHWGYDSSARILSETVAMELSAIAIENREAFKAIQPSTAIGSDLDGLADLPFGVQRNIATFAEVGVRHNCISFYVDGGTFGDINAGQNIVISAGTLISSEQIGSQDRNRADYRVTAETVLPSTSSLAYVPARAVTAGPSQNVGERTLVYHNFTNYIAVDSGRLKVTNRFNILNGQDQEDDDRLRYRMSRQYASLVQTNIDKIKLNGIDVPGLEDVRIISGYFGIGTAACFAFGIDEESNQQLADDLQSKLSTINGPGIALIAVPGIAVYIDLELRVRLTENLTASQRISLERAMKGTIFNAIKDESRGGNVNLGIIADRITSSYPEITALISNPHSLDKFEAAYIRKLTTGTTFAERQKLLTPVVTLDEEEFATMGTLDVSYEIKAVT